MIKLIKTNKKTIMNLDRANVTKEQLISTINEHNNDIQKGFTLMSMLMEMRAQNHDHSKLENIDLYHKTFQNNFTDNKQWRNLHHKEERHHLRDTDNIPDDVNLIDVMEMLIDEVMVGSTFKDKYIHKQVDAELLKKAFDNTATLLLNSMEVSK